MKYQNKLISSRWKKWVIFKFWFYSKLGWKSDHRWPYIDGNKYYFLLERWK